MGGGLTAENENWVAVIYNLRKARKQWEQMLQILGWEGANVQVHGLFYKYMVQTVLLYRS